MTDLIDIYKRYRLTGIISNLFCKCIGYLGCRLYFGTIFYVNLPHTISSANTTFKKLNLSDFLGQSEPNSTWFTDSKLKDIRYAFEVDGNEAYGIYYENLLICYGWISLKYFMPNKIELASTDGYLWDDYTHPLYRGRGLHRELLLYRCTKLAEYGKTRALSIIARYNYASKVGYEKSGFKRISNFINYGIGEPQLHSTFLYNGAEELIIINTNRH